MLPLEKHEKQERSKFTKFVATQIIAIAFKPKHFHHNHLVFTNVVYSQPSKTMFQYLNYLTLAMIYAIQKLLSNFWLKQATSS